MEPSVHKFIDHWFDMLQLYVIFDDRLFKLRILVAFVLRDVVGSNGIWWDVCTCIHMYGDTYMYI